MATSLKDEFPMFQNRGCLFCSNRNNIMYSYEVFAESQNASQLLYVSVEQIIFVSSLPFSNKLLYILKEHFALHTIMLYTCMCACMLMFKIRIKIMNKAFRFLYCLPDSTVEETSIMVTEILKQHWNYVISSGSSLCVIFMRIKSLTCDAVIVHNHCHNQCQNTSVQERGERTWQWKGPGWIMPCSLEPSH